VQKERKNSKFKYDKIERDLATKSNKWCSQGKGEDRLASCYRIIRKQKKKCRWRQKGNRVKEERKRSVE